MLETGDGKHWSARRLPSSNEAPAADETQEHQAVMGDQKRDKRKEKIYLLCLICFGDEDHDGDGGIGIRHGKRRKGKQARDNVVTLDFTTPTSFEWIFVIMVGR